MSYTAWCFLNPSFANGIIIKVKATYKTALTENILKTKRKLNEILAANTGKSIEEIERDTERDNFMSAEEAKAYGLIDEIITKPQK